MSTSEATQRALAAYDAMQATFFQRDGSNLYAEHVPAQKGDHRHTSEWPFSQAHVATINLLGIRDVAGRDIAAEVRARTVGQERYWSATSATGLPGYLSNALRPYDRGGDLFYDDNAWVALALLRLHTLTGDAGALVRARQIFALLVSGWDTDATHAAPGGVFWTQARWSRDRNTVSTMPAAEVGLRLHRLTGDADALDWARRMYDWTNNYLLAPNGLYWDHLDLAGAVEPTQWSYNQGVPIGVHLLLHQVTGEAVYLDRAVRLADAALEFYGQQNRLQQQPPAFNAIFLEHLLALQAATSDERYATAARDYAEWAWQSRRDARGVFVFDPKGPAALLDNAAMTRLYAALAWNPADWSNL